jgi:hypothetical protein
MGCEVRRVVSEPVIVPTTSLQSITTKLPSLVRVSVKGADDCTKLAPPLVAITVKGSTTVGLAVVDTERVSPLISLTILDILNS